MFVTNFIVLQLQSILKFSEEIVKIMKSEAPFLFDSGNGTQENVVTDAGFIFNDPWATESHDQDMHCDTSPMDSRGLFANTRSPSAALLTACSAWSIAVIPGSHTAVMGFAEFVTENKAHHDSVILAHQNVERAKGQLSEARDQAQKDPSLSDLVARFEEVLKNLMQEREIFDKGWRDTTNNYFRHMPTPGVRDFF